GRTRRPALRAARRVLAEHGARADVVLLHDPELLLALPGAVRDWDRATPGRRPAVVWDVHEDTAAALADKPWVPGPLRRPLALAVRAAERAAERRIHLLLAEDGYRDRFRLPHPVVANLVRVPPDPPAPPGPDRAVYLGHLSRARGAAELVETARLLGPDFRVEVIGAADPAVRPALAAADRDGLLRWHGFLPHDAALGRLGGALAGLSLLHDRPNYRHSRPTKVLEYMAYGIPVVTTPNPSAAELVRAHGCGLVVPHGEPAAVAAALRRLRDEPGQRRAMGARGHAAARAFHWPDAAGDFVARLESWAGRAPARPPAPAGS
uniref:glycosyltransferase n=1 Tax=Streptomyces sp. YIM 98790 TaxID=2689077 RepID=UPI00140A7241